MKSVFITFVIFIAVFGILKANIFALISSSAFHYLTYFLLFAVICCAVYFVGLPHKNHTESLTTENQEEKEKNADKE